MEQLIYPSLSSISYRNTERLSARNLSLGKNIIALFSMEITKTICKVKASAMSFITPTQNLILFSI